MSQNFAITFVICDRVEGYKDTDLASLNEQARKIWIVILKFFVIVFC